MKLSEQLNIIAAILEGANTIEAISKKTKLKIVDLHYYLNEMEKVDLIKLDYFKLYQLSIHTRVNIIGNLKEIK